MQDNAPRKLHPLMMVAAISVTVASLAAVGVMTGLLPGKKTEAPAPASAPIVAEAPASAQAVQTVPPTTAAATSEPAPATTEPKPAAKPAKPPVSKKAAGEHAGQNLPPPPPAATSAGSVAVAPSVPAAPAAPPVCHECGTIESVREMTQKGEGTGLGAVAGGVLGGVLGHQVGSGRGKDLATVAGAVGGAVAGHQVEKYQRRTTRYEITVRMDDGSTQTVTAESQPSWRAGDRVKVNSGTIVPML